MAVTVRLKPDEIWRGSECDGCGDAIERNGDGYDTTCEACVDRRLMVEVADRAALLLNTILTAQRAGNLSKTAMLALNDPCAMLRRALAEAQNYRAFAQ